MNTFTIESNLRLISLNSAFATLRNGRRIKSKQYVKFKRDIDLIMKSKLAEFDIFNRSFNAMTQEVSASLTIYTPDLFTLKGCINKKSGDIPNYEKCLTDTIMTGLIDDSQITYWEMRKLYRDTHGFCLTLEIVNR